MSRRRVLMFAYYFPPLGGGGVQRTLKHVKYLPAHGFDSIVIAGDKRGLALRDEGLSREVPPETIVVRPAALPLQLVQNKLDGLLRRIGLPVRLVNEILWPDAFVGWLPGAVAAGLREARRHRPAVLYSTSTPITAHLAALLVHRLTGLPWVADFRDPWTRNTVTGPAAPHRVLRRVSAKLEELIVSSASVVTVVDESVELVGMEPGDPRYVVIRNGVDEEDFRAGPRASRSGRARRFTLAHVGSLYGSRDAAPVLRALAELIAEGRVAPAELDVRIVGHASPVSSPPASLPVTMTGYVDHDRALTEMREASALLFYQPPDCRGSSGKVYEYLGTGRPVLCVADPDNLGYQLVHELGGGRCADVRNPLAVRAAIEDLLDAWRRGDRAVDSGAAQEVLARFSRRRFAGELAAVLREAVASRRTFRTPPSRSSSTVSSSAG